MVVLYWVLRSDRLGRSEFLAVFSKGIYMDHRVLVVCLYHLPVLAASHKHHDYSIDTYLKRTHVRNRCIPSN